MLFKNHLFVKLISLLSLIRGQNLMVLLVAQLLSSAFIFASVSNPLEIFFDLNLWMILLATSVSVAAGYILNAFFDQEKDLINRPHKTLLEQNISERTKLISYIIFNVIALLIASYVSQRSVIFFCVYIGSMAFYSAFLKRYLFMGNLGSATLTVLPFFAITVYYKNFTLEIFTLAAFLMLLLSIKELMKDLCNLKGDLTNNYKTIPTAFGENITKWLITLMITFCHGVVILLYFFFTLNSMLYYFLFSLILLLVFGLFIWRSSMNNHMAMILLGIKFLIVLGIFSLPLLRIPM